MNVVFRWSFLFMAFLACAVSGAAIGQTVFTASGANPAAIQAAVDTFRTALGTLNPNTSGSVGSGRREINWDGVPDASAAPNNLPANFFNVNSPRGVVFSTPGTGFQVSANAGVAPVRFDNISAGYSMSFQTFSAQRLFTALGSNVVDINFFVPGSNAPALSNGFGAVFTDVDTANLTSIQLFDKNNVSLGQFFALPADNGLSFLGILQPSSNIARVRIIAGNAALGDITPDDLVVMDDFIYGEPIATNLPPSIRKEFGAASIPLNGTTSLTFIYQNLNTTTSLTGVGFVDTLPAGLVVSSPAGLSGNCGGGTITATSGSNVISLSGATLAPNPSPDSSCSFAVTGVTGTTAGVKNNSVTVTSNEGGTGNTATASLTVLAGPLTPIPTLSRWSLALLATVLALGAVLYLRRRHT